MARMNSPNPAAGLTVKGFFALIEGLGGFVDKAAWAVAKILVAAGLVITVWNAEFPKSASQTQPAPRQLDATVNDPDGNPILGEAITLLDLATGQRQVLRADESGKISTPLRGADPYEVRFDQADAAFRFQVPANQSVSWSLTLQPARNNGRAPAIRTSQ